MTPTSLFRGVAVSLAVAGVLFVRPVIGALFAAGVARQRTT